MQIDTRLFEPQIVSLVLTFLDQYECGRLQYTSKSFDVYLNNLEFRISSCQSRPIRKTQYLHWIVSRHIKLGWLSKDLFRRNLSSAADIQNLAKITIHLTTDLAAIEFKELENWHIFISSLKLIARETSKPYHTLRRIHLDFFEHFEGVVDLRVFADLFPDLQEFKFQSINPVDFGSLVTFKKLTKLWISANLNFSFLTESSSETLQWTSLLNFKVQSNDYISDDCIDVLTKCSIQLELVELSFCKRITNRSIHSLTKHCKLLRYVMIMSCFSSEMHELYKEVRRRTNNFQSSFDPNLFKLGNTEETCFPNDCHVKFGKELTLLVDRNMNYVIVPLLQLRPITSFLFFDSWFAEYYDETMFYSTNFNQD